MSSPAPVPLIEYPPWLGDRRGPEGGSKGAPPAPDPDQWILDMRKYFSSPSDKAFLDDLIARGVKVTAYDKIWFDDPYYDGKKWTTKRFNAGGTTNGNNITMIRRADADRNATVIYHEGVHTGQPDSMKWRDKEYDAYTKEDQWRQAHGLAPFDPSFRKTDADGKVVTDPAAVKAFVDSKYPGVAVAGPGGTVEEVVGKDADGNTIVRREDGSSYSRPPREGDSYPGPRKTDPPTGIPVDLKKLRGS